MIHTIKRGFVDAAYGQIHYRTAGEGATLVMLHASPGSSRQLAGLIGDFAGDARVIAPDTSGNGDSPPLPLAAPQITDLAQAALGFLDAMGLGQVRLYGSHTGAAIAAELAILVPDRVDRLVLDGVQLLSDTDRADYLARYAHPFLPDLEGTHLLRAFQFCRDQYLFFPWYDRTVAGQRVGGLPDPQVLHDWVVEVLKAHDSYHLNYRAAFQWLGAERLPLVRCPTLVIAAANDPLIQDTRTSARLTRNARFVELPRLDAVDYSARRKAAMTEFLAAVG